MSTSALKMAVASRRGVLKSAGLLIVGFNIAGDAGQLLAQSTGNPTGLVDATQVDSWLSIAADGSITAYSGKIEFGQGFSTVQTQLIAEELFVPISSVTVVFGNTGITPDQGVTSGSQSTVSEFLPVACVRPWTQLAMRCFRWHRNILMSPQASSSCRMECSQ
jgi:Molybdopterin-binding domain of aldehyde dehydrogenase